MKKINQLKFIAYVYEQVKKFFRLNIIVYSVSLCIISEQAGNRGFGIQENGICTTPREKGYPREMCYFAD